VKKEQENQNYNLVAKTFFGLEELLADEIREIGAKDVEIGRRMVSFKGDKEILYKANIYLRTGLRVLKTLHSFKINNQDDYYKFLRNIEWEKVLGLHHTFAIDSVVHSEIFSNSLFAAQRAKDAIVDSFRAKYHKRPLVDTQNPDVLINIHISDKRVDVALDSSGLPLNRRGYRVAEGPAPINQVLAAALIKLSGWDINTPFIDPMTGSGTFAIEAAMIARNMPPGMIRKDFCFQNWPDYDRKLYRKLLEEIELNDFRPTIIANDIDEGMIEIARQNASKANLASVIRFNNKAFEIYKPRVKEGTIIMNPPYGERLEKDEIQEFYEDIGDTLKERFQGFTAWIISSNMDAMKYIALKPSSKKKVFNGNLECVYAGFEMFTGSMKEYKTKLNQDK
jgi:putative N6-adenine-specific DNA methylase